MKGFKVPNSLFRLGLKHAPLAVYLYLLAKQQDNCATSTYGQMAAKLEISVRTAFTAVHTLENKGLVSISYVRRGGKIAALKFTMRQFPQSSWVWVEKRIFDYHLSTSELLVYLYIKSRANGSGRAFPSVAVIHKDTGLSEQTIRDAAKSLSALSLLRRKHYIKVNGSFGNNNYFIIGCAEHETIMKGLRKKKARTHKPGRGNALNFVHSGGLKIAYLIKTHRSTIQYKKKKAKFSG